MRYRSLLVLSLAMILVGGTRPSAAAGILALSGFHVSESHTGTVDAASVFFIYAFLTLMVFAASRKWRPGLWASPLFPGD